MKRYASEEEDSSSESEDDEDHDDRQLVRQLDASRAKPRDERKNLKSKQVPTAVSHNQELDQDDEESFADAVPKRKQRARESEHASVSKPRDERKEVKAKRTERSATRIDDLQEEEIRDGVSDEQDILPPPTSADKRKKKKFSKKVSF